jgi:hypothetical protein
VLCTETNAVCSDIHIKHINKLCGENVEFTCFTVNGAFSNYRPSKGQSDKTRFNFRSYLESVQVNEKWFPTDQSYWCCLLTTLDKVTENSRSPKVIYSYVVTFKTVESLAVNPMLLLQTSATFLRHWLKLTLSSGNSNVRYAVSLNCEAAPCCETKTLENIASVLTFRKTQYIIQRRCV